MTNKKEKITHHSGGFTRYYDIKKTRKIHFCQRCYNIIPVGSACCSTSHKDSDLSNTIIQEYTCLRCKDYAKHHQYYPAPSIHLRRLILDEMKKCELCQKEINLSWYIDKNNSDGFGNVFFQTELENGDTSDYISTKFVSRYNECFNPYCSNMPENVQFICDDCIDLVIDNNIFKVVKFDIDKEEEMSLKLVPKY